MKDERTESQIQSAFVERLAWSGIVTGFAIPNGAKFGRDPRLRAMQMQKLKREGVRRGVPDFCLPVPSCGFHGLWIEFKARNEKPDDDQLWWLSTLAGFGHVAAWTRSDDKAFDLVSTYLRGSPVRLLEMVPGAPGFFLDRARAFSVENLRKSPESDSEG